MANEEKKEIEFESIQRIFAARDAKREQEKNNSKVTPIFSNPKYDTMHAKNIKITNNGYSKILDNLKKHKKLIVAIGVTIGIVVSEASLSHALISPNPITEPIIEEPGKDEPVLPDETIIIPENCDLSNMTIMLRGSTDNVEDIVETTAEELTELGVDNTVVSRDNYLEEIKDRENEDTDREIIVINVDGKANNGLKDVIVMTNYVNESKSADNLAIAIKEESINSFNASSDIVCGKKDVKTGERVLTSVEKGLLSKGLNDVPCLTVAVSNEYMLKEELADNNVATAITNGVIRFASLDAENRYDDTIRRLEVADTISGLAIANDVDEEYIYEANSDKIANGETILQYGDAFIVKHINNNLTDSVTVENKAVTTDISDIQTQYNYYEVKEGDTLSEIADNLKVRVDDLIIDKEDRTDIAPGDKIGYEKMEGPILVSNHSNEKTN